MVFDSCAEVSAWDGSSDWNGSSEPAALENTVKWLVVIFSSNGCDNDIRWETNSLAGLESYINKSKV